MLRFAMCNEAFDKAPFAQVCKEIRKAGYTGIELAPFTLGDSPAAISASQRRELRRTMNSEGLDFVGLHWLLVSQHTFHVTTPDAALRERSWSYVRDLADLCSDLASEPTVMVFGSPKQRSTTGGSTREQATERFRAGLAGVAPHAETRGVTILVEALPANQCDVVQTLAEAAEIVREVGSPAIQTMFDTHNAIDEVTSHTDLLEQYFPLIRHVHVNEIDGRRPGTGAYNFEAILKTLEKLDYKGWVSLEVFDFSPDPETIAQQSLAYLRSGQRYTHAETLQ